MEALCYIPFAWALTSGFALMTSKEPRLRFIAKQSLLHGAFTIAIAVLGTIAVITLTIFLAVVLAALELAGAVESATDMDETLAIVFLIGWILVFLLSIASEIYPRAVAVYRLDERNLWVMPWLAFIAKGWLPNKGEDLVEVFR